MTAKQPTPVLHISNLKQKKNSQQLIEETLITQCSKYGKIIGLKFIQQANYKNMCLIEFDNVAQAINVMIHMHNYPILGRKI